ADPVISLMLALAVLAARINGIAFDRLALERRAFGDPILEGAGLKIEIERLAVRADRKHAGIFATPVRRILRGREGFKKQKYQDGNIGSIHRLPRERRPTLRIAD